MILPSLFEVVPEQVTGVAVATNGGGTQEQFTGSSVTVLSAKQVVSVAYTRTVYNVATAGFGNVLAITPFAGIDVLIGGTAAALLKAAPNEY